MSGVMWWDDVLLAVNVLPAAAVRQLAEGPLDDATAPEPACRVCAALDGIDSPLGDWHGGEDGGHTFPALASARCMVIYAVAACLLAMESSGGPHPVWRRLAAGAKCAFVNCNRPRVADRAVAPNEAQWSPESPTALLIEEMRREIARQNAKLSAFRVLEAAARAVAVDIEQRMAGDERLDFPFDEDLAEGLAWLRAALAGLEAGRQ